MRIWRLPTFCLYLILAALFLFLAFAVVYLVTYATMMGYL